LSKEIWDMQFKPGFWENDIRESWKGRPFVEEYDLYSITCVNTTWPWCQKVKVTLWSFKFEEKALVGTRMFNRPLQGPVLPPNGNSWWSTFGQASYFTFSSSSKTIDGNTMALSFMNFNCLEWFQVDERCIYWVSNLAINRAKLNTCPGARSWMLYILSVQQMSSKCAVQRQRWPLT
jgi:hypothetical protein